MPTTFRRIAALLVLTLLGTAVAVAQDFDLGGFGDGATISAPPFGNDPVRTDLRLSADGVAPGTTINLAVVFDIEKPYHIQTRRPELKILIPTEVKPTTLPPGVVAADFQWPEPEPLKVDFGDGEQELDFYAGEAPVFMKLRVSGEVPTGEHDFAVEVTYQACDDRVCLPPETKTLTTTLNVVARGTTTAPTHAELFNAYTGASAELPAEGLVIPLFGYDFEIDPNNLVVLLVLSAIGGFLLNFTPCVLPLIPIKIMGLTQSAGNRGKAILLGAIMSAGVVGFWLGLGLAVALVSGFGAANQLFQYPAFTITVGVVIAIMGAGMCGAFATSLPQWVYRIQPKHDSIVGSFGFGIMTAVLSTPCTAPMMGATAAWSATQGVTITLITFAAIGIGMALPYFVLSVFPKLVEKMPRTGPASELIKQVMGLLMIAAATYFLGTGVAGLTSTPPDPPTRLYWWLVALAIAAAGAWLAYRTVRITTAPGKRVTFAGLGLVFITLAVLIGVRFTDRGPIDWVYYTPDRLTEARASGKTVVLEFTAEWCLNCHALEQTVLHDKRVVELFNSDSVVPIKVDLTGNNVAGNAKLLEVGRRTIPLLVIYGPDGIERFKSDAYTVRQLVAAIDKPADTGVAKIDTDAAESTPDADTDIAIDDDEDELPPLGPSPVSWQKFSDDAVDAALRSGKVVVLDFAADWCGDCRRIETTVLRHPDVVPLLNSDDVIAIKGDMTDDSPAALAAEARMKALGHVGVPYLFVFGRDGKTVFEGEEVTTEQLIDAIDRARG